MTQLICTKLHQWIKTKQKMRFATIIGILLVVFSCSKMDDDYYDEQLTEDEIQIEQIIDSLNQAYTANSSDKLVSFLDFWYSDVIPKERSDIESDIELNIYKIFKEIYNPFNIDLLGNHEWGSDMYEGLEYVIVQNKIFYDFNFNIENTTTTDSVIDFRPDVVFRDAKALYLTDKYNVAINTFLGSDFNQTVTSGANAPYVPVAESYSRLQFINQELAIIPGHWGNYWHIETHPYISSIHLDSDMLNARVNFRVGYMFGEAILQRSNSTWQLVSSDINAIE